MHAADTLRDEGYDGRITVVDADANTPYDRPPLSKQVLTGDWDAERIALPGGHARTSTSTGASARRAIGLDLGRPVRAPRRRRPASATTGWCIATGAAARRLPGSADARRRARRCARSTTASPCGPSSTSCPSGSWSSAPASSAPRWPPRAAAAASTSRCSRRSPCPLERALGAEMGMVWPSSTATTASTSASASASTGSRATDRVEGVRLDRRHASSTPTVVVVGIGVAPNTGWLDGLGARRSTTASSATRPCVAAPGVVAAGDIARWPSPRFGEVMRVEHWENAIADGRGRGPAAAGRARRRRRPRCSTRCPWFWSDQYDRKIQLAGRSGADDEVEVVHRLDRRAPLRRALRPRRPRRRRARHEPAPPRHAAAGARRRPTPWTDGLARARELA